MRGDKSMDEFVGIAIWILMGFLMVNASIMWFQSSDTFAEFDLNGTGMKTQDAVDYESVNTTDNCSTVSNNLLQYAPCVLSQSFGLVTGVTAWLWNLLTAWVSVLDLSLTNLGSIGYLMKIILIPFFALVQIFAIMVIGLRLAGIVRGGS